VRRAADSVDHALYLITDDRDVPFEPDGLRDGEAIRSWMTGRFLELLRETVRPHILLAGDRESRLRAAIAATRRLVADGWAFAAPFLPAAAP
jgi:HTH-type transcriptional regulator, transcriptional repressor of NAD biosynthesis genes